MTSAPVIGSSVWSRKCIKVFEVFAAVESVKTSDVVAGRKIGITDTYGTREMRKDENAEEVDAKPCRGSRS